MAWGRRNSHFYRKKKCAPITKSCMFAAYLVCSKMDELSAVLLFWIVTHHWHQALSNTHSHTRRWLACHCNSSEIHSKFTEGILQRKWITILYRLNVLLTPHHSKSVQWNQHGALSIQLIKNWWPLHVPSITCLSSEGAPQAAFGILSAYYISWLHPGAANWYNTHTMYQMPLMKRLLRISK
jgi:hypothetical protein